MNYQKFILKSQRNNQLINDKIHYFSKYFYNFFAFIFYKLRLTPNLVTFLFLLSGLISAYQFYKESYISGYIFWRLVLIIDMADGALARATNSYSKSSYIFDKFNHIVINLLLIFIFGKNIENFFLIYLLTVSYLNYYLFNNFAKKEITYNHLPNRFFFRDIITFEGFIFFVIILNIFTMENYISFLYCFFTFSFFIIYLYKLYLFNK